MGKYKDFSKEQKLRANARSIANVYQKRKILERKPCEICGDSRSQKHHPDYDFPIYVKWLCLECHKTQHRQEKIAIQIGILKRAIRIVRETTDGIARTM